MKLRIIENVIIEARVVESGTELETDPETASNLIRIGCAEEIMDSKKGKSDPKKKPEK